MMVCANCTGTLPELLVRYARDLCALCSGYCNDERIFRQRAVGSRMRARELRTDAEGSPAFAELCSMASRHEEMAESYELRAKNARTSLHARRPKAAEDAAEPAA